MEKNLCPATYSNLSVYVWGWLTASTANWIITPCNALTEGLKNVLESQRQERRKMNSHSISPIFDWRIVLSDRSIFAWQSVCAIAISRLVWASHTLDCPSSLQYRIRLKTFLAWPAKWFRKFDMKNVRKMHQIIWCSDVTREFKSKDDKDLLKYFLSLLRDVKFTLLVYDQYKRAY